MTNLLVYPLEDWYEADLVQELLSSETTSFTVSQAPNFTFPSWVTTYAVINAGKSNMEIIEISAYSWTTITIANRARNKWASVSWTANNHAVWSKVIISDNFAFWEDIANSIATKLDNDWGNSTTTWDLQVWWDFRFRLDWSTMKFKDWSQSEISLSDLALGTGTDEKVKNSTDDTTAWYLNQKIVWWDGINTVTVNPLGNEQIRFNLDLADTTVFKDERTTNEARWVVTKASDWYIDNSFLDISEIKTDIWSADESTPALVQKASDAVATAWTNTTYYISPEQAKNKIDLYIPVWWTDYELAAANTAKSIDFASYTLVKEISIPFAWTYTVEFELFDANASTAAYWRIYVNWIAVWTQRVHNVDWTWSSTYSEDITVSAWDLIQLYWRQDWAWLGTCQARNFQVNCNLNLRQDLYNWTVNTD